MRNFIYSNLRKVFGYKMLNPVTSSVFLQRIKVECVLILLGKSLINNLLFHVTFSFTKVLFKDVYLTKATQTWTLQRIEAVVNLPDSLCLWQYYTNHNYCTYDLGKPWRRLRAEIITRLLRHIWVLQCVDITTLYSSAVSRVLFIYYCLP